jgi:hypothetical protein
VEKNTLCQKMNGRDVMDIELLVNENGKIVAAVECRPAELIGASAPSGEIPLARPTLRARPGQTRHILTLSAEIANTPLKVILQTHRFVIDAEGPRLEKVIP